MVQTHGPVNVCKDLLVYHVPLVSVAVRISLFPGFSTSRETGNFQKFFRKSRDPKHSGIFGIREIPGKIFRGNLPTLIIRPQEK